MNYSEQREKILSVINGNTTHPTADEMLSILQSQGANVGTTTLYRNLNKLTASGIIRKIDGLDTSSHYDYNISPHYHFICEKCKRVFDIPSDIAPDVVERTQEMTGFEVTSCDILIRGICSECKKRKENN